MQFSHFLYHKIVERLSRASKIYEVIKIIYYVQFSKISYVTNKADPVLKKNDSFFYQNG